MTAHLWFWAAVGLLIAAVIALAATVYGYSREVASLREDVETLNADHIRLAGRLNQLARYVVADPTTGPINVLDRPTPAQIAAPTVPDLQAQPKVPRGRHRLVA